MAHHRVLKPFIMKDQLGKEVERTTGQVIDVLQADLTKKLLGKGFIAPSCESSGKTLVGKPAAKCAKVKRIGIWMYTSDWYSGGRIHMYQLAVILAELGWHVYLITNKIPRWKVDYPETENLHIVLEGQGRIPPDLDMILTDSKTDLGKNALLWRERHSIAPLVCMNFETPNWVQEYCPDYAQRLNVPKNIFQAADFLLANSNLSRKFLQEWLAKGDGEKQQCWVIPPAVNTHKITAMLEGKLITNRPFAVWSARSPAYKGGRVAIDAIWALKTPFDLVTFGRVDNPPPNTALHKICLLKGQDDATKFLYMRHAQLVLAPSLFEGYGMVPAEALSVGTPVMVYDLPVLREEYGEPDGMHYVKSGDKAAFKKKLAELVTQDKQPANPAPIIEKHGMDGVKKIVDSVPLFAFKKSVITAHMVAYWGFIPESLESVYSHVDKIAIAFGPVPNAPIIDDGSRERLLAWIAEHDVDNKIIFQEKSIWKKGKLEMRDWCCQQAEGNYMLLLDGDEIWVGLDEWIEKQHPFGCPRWLNFWHDSSHWIHDTGKQSGIRWGYKLDPQGSTCPHYRWSWWRASYAFRRHHALPLDHDDNPLHLRDKDIASGSPESIIYHLGHALPPVVMTAKHEFYLKRDGDDAGRRGRRDCWTDWDGKAGDCGDGIVEKVDWELPEIVQRGFKSVALLGATS